MSERLSTSAGEQLSQETEFRESLKKPIMIRLLLNRTKKSIAFGVRASTGD